MNARDPQMPIDSGADDGAQSLLAYAERAWDEQIVPAMTDAVQTGGGAAKVDDYEEECRQRVQPEMGAQPRQTEYQCLSEATSRLKQLQSYLRVPILLLLNQLQLQHLRYQLLPGQLSFLVILSLLPNLRTAASLPAAPGCSWKK